MDKLYAKISEQHTILQQQNDVKSLDDEIAFIRALDRQPFSISLPMTPAAEGVSGPTAPTARSASAAPNEGPVSTEEILRLKLELAQAQSKISRLGQQLEQTRLVSQESGRVTPSLLSESDFASTVPLTTSPIAARIPDDPTVNGYGRPPFNREHSWMIQEDTRSDISDCPSAGAFSRARGIWNNSKTLFPNHLPRGQVIVDGPQAVTWTNTRVTNPSYDVTFTAPGTDMYRQDRMVPEQDAIRPMGRRGNRYDSRFGPTNSFGGGFGGYNLGAGQFEPGYSAGLQGAMPGSMGMGLYSPYPQQPVGTPLSPHATEFTSSAASWKPEVSSNHSVGRARSIANLPCPPYSLWPRRHRLTYRPRQSPSTIVVFLTVT